MESQTSPNKYSTLMFKSHSICYGYVYVFLYNKNICDYWRS